MEGDQAGDDIDLSLPWYSPEIDLPESLQAVSFWSTKPLSTETRRFLLKDVPEVHPNPIQAPVNNYRSDRQREVDSLPRNWLPSIFQLLGFLSTAQACADSEDPPVDH